MNRSENLDISEIPAPVEALSYFGFDKTGRLLRNGCADIALRAGGVIGGMGYCNNMVIGSRCPVTFDATQAFGPGCEDVPIHDVCRQTLIANKQTTASPEV